MRKAALVLVALVGLCGPIYAADNNLAGSYTARGWDPGDLESDKPSYSGTAQLKEHGDLLLYEGEMDGHSYVGVGIFHPESKTLALHFTEVDSGRVGVAHFSCGLNELSGLWAWLKDQQGKLGKEIWRRKK
jgi:hypothetical protein